MGKVVSMFRIGGVTHKVKYVDNILDPYNNRILYGTHNPTTGIITVAKELGDLSISEDMQKLTFYHELGHAFLNAMNWRFDEKNQEEDFAERLGRVMLEYEQTKELVDERDLQTTKGSKVRRVPKTNKKL